MREQELVYFNDFRKLRKTHPDKYYKPTIQKEMYEAWRSNPRGFFNEWQTRVATNDKNSRRVS